MTQRLALVTRSHSPALRRRRRRDGGFTLLEILVVIGIIMLLLGIGLIAYRAIDAAGARKATYTSLATGDAMIAEYSVNNAGSLSQLPGARTTDALINASGGYDVNSGTGRTQVASTTGTTGAAVVELIKIPRNQAIMAQLPRKLSTVHLDTGDVTCLADAWGNPLLLVPPAGLMVYTGGSSSSKPVGTKTTILNPTPNRPFWASAGPDGDFATGDDNIYSFEK